jgi:ubiquinone/menaquinone biosynthesis C-methylase UbiE
MQLGMACLMNFFSSEGTMRFPPDDEERKEWQNPVAVLKAIGLREGDIFVDVGCGEGFFALPAARMVGLEGAVFGIDINTAAIDRLSQAAAAEGLKHLRAIAGRAESTIVCRHCAHVIFYGICLHDFQNPSAVLTCARSMIRDEGVIIDLDWKSEPTLFGPPVSIRFSVAKARRLIEGAGFTIRSVQDASPWHYCIRAIPR